MQIITFETAILGRITIDLHKNRVDFHDTNTIESLRRNEEGDWVFSHIGWGEFGIEFLGTNRWALRRRSWETLAEGASHSEAIRAADVVNVR